MFLSLVVPICRDQWPRLANSLAPAWTKGENETSPDLQSPLAVHRTEQGIKALRAMLPYKIEVMVVDDGTRDESLQLAHSLGFETARADAPGYGAAIQMGMLSAKGLYRAVVDPAWSIAPEQLLMMIPPALPGADVAIANRFHSASTRKEEPLVAQVSGRLFNRLVQSVLLPGFTDTQCSFKVWRAEAARAVFSRCLEQGWAIDLEALALADTFGLKVREVPVDWRYAPALRQRPIPGGLQLLAGLARVRARLTAGAYPPLRSIYSHVEEVEQLRI